MADAAETARKRLELMERMRRSFSQAKENERTVWGDTPEEEAARKELQTDRPTLAPRDDDGALTAAAKWVGRIPGGLGGRIVSRAAEWAGEPETRDRFFESSTGYRWLSDDEIARLPPRLRREAVNRQSFFLKNALDDTKDLAKGLAHLAVQPAQAAADVIYGGDESELGAHAPPDIGVRDIAAGAARSMGEFLVDPTGQALDAPIEALGNVAMVAPLGAAAVAGARPGLTAGRAALQTGSGVREAASAALSAGRAPARAAVVATQEALSPAKWATRGLRAALPDTLAQWLVDRYAGVNPRVVEVLKEHKLNTRADIDEAISKIQDLGDKGLTPAQLDDLTRALDDDFARTSFLDARTPDGPQTLAAARRELLDEPERYMDDVAARMQSTANDLSAARAAGRADTERALGKTPRGEVAGGARANVQQLPVAEVERELVRDALTDWNEAARMVQLGRALDDDLARLEGAYTKLVESRARMVDDAMASSPMQTLHDGRVLGSSDFLRAPTKVDPAKITVNVADSAPDWMKAIEPNLTAIRRLQAKISNDLVDTNVGIPGRGVLSQKAQWTHEGNYLRSTKMPDPTDAWAGERSLAEILVPGIEKGGADFSKRAAAKHALSLEDQIAAGRIGGDQLLDIMRMDVAQKIATTRKYQLFDELAKLTDDAGNKLAIDEAAYKALSSAERKNWMPVPKELVPDTPLPRFGALSGMYLPKPAGNIVKNLEASQHAVLKAWREGIQGWKGFKIAWNPGSHMGQALEHLWKAEVDSYASALTAPLGAGGLAGGASLMMGTRSLLKRDEWYRAARRLGLIDETNTSQIGALTEGVKSAESWAQATSRLKPPPGSGKVSDYAKMMIGLYKWASTESKMGKVALRVWTASDQAAKIAALQRAVARRAGLRAMATPKNTRALAALDDQAILRAARDDVLRLYPEYDAVPLLFEKADKYGLLPFTRYTYTAQHVLSDLVTKRPIQMAIAREIPRQRYERGSREYQERTELQPQWMDGLGVPTPGTKDQTINMRYSTAPPVSDLWSIRGEGAYGADRFDEKWRWSSPLALPLELAAGEDFAFRRSLRDQHGNLKMGDAFWKVAYTAGPGVLYHLKEKIVPAATGEMDRRGRRFTRAGAVGHAAGWRSERVTPAQIRADIEKGYRAAIKDAQDNARRLVKTGAEGKQVADELRAKVAKLRKRRLELLGLLR